MGEPVPPTALLLTPLNILGRRWWRGGGGGGLGGGCWQDAGSYSVDSRTVAQADWMCGDSFVRLQGYLLGRKGNTWERVNM